MADLRTMPGATKDNLQAAAQRYFQELAAAVDVRRGFEPDHFEEEVAWNVEATDERIDDLRRQLITNNYDGQVRHAAKALLAQAGLDGASQLQAEKFAARAQLEQMRLLRHLLTTPDSDFAPSDALFGTTSSEYRATTEPASQHRPVGLTMSSAAGMYLSARKSRLALKTIQEVSRALDWAMEHFHPDRPLNSISKADARSLRDAILSLSRQHQGRGKLSFAERQTAQPSLRISTRTADKYWGFLRSWFRWCHREGHLETDPTEGLIVEIAKQDRSRSPTTFSQEELAALFRTPLFAGHRSPRQLNIEGPCRSRGSYWWMVMLALFTGMRAGEVATLLTTDFDFASEVPVVVVRPTNASGQQVKALKTDSSVRQIPLAGALLTLGLEEFVAQRFSVWGEQRLFRDVRIGSASNSDGFSKFVGRLLRGAGLHSRGRGPHTLRHGVAQALRRGRASEAEISAILGHAPQTVTAQYGGQFPLQRLAEAVNAIDYGFDVVELVGGRYDPSLQVH